VSKEHILVVEDEEDIQELIQYNLGREGYRVTCVGSGEEGLKAAQSRYPDIVLLDLMLPGMDGLEVCRRLRGNEGTRRLPILILSAKGEESDIVAGLELGADDYVTKPFSPRELLARLRAVLRRDRRSGADEARTISIHGIVIDAAHHQVTARGKPLKLTLSEFRILELLAGHPDRVYTRNQIIEALRGDDYPVTDRSIDVHIVALRRKLGPAGRHIDTVRGVGYRMKK
jgi:two-component system alkaline phosphatase synthesis response regulator PhoP